MATSGSVYSSYARSTRYRVDWKRTDYSISGNWSKIKWTLYLESGNYWYNNAVVINSIYINGTKVLGETKWSNKYVGTYELQSGELTIYHSSDGTKSFSISISGSFYEEGSVSGSKSFTLDTIPRYATASQSLASKTETSITMNWSSDSTIDYVWYSIDDGKSWTAVGSVNQSSGSYVISGLNPGTTYKVKTSLRRKDSQLSTNSSVSSIATYAWPYCSAAPAFEIGKDANLTIYNPLSRSVSITAKASDGTVILETTTTGTGVKIPASVADTLYRSIPNAKSGTYTVTVEYSGHTKDTTGTYSAGAAAAPDITGATYQDKDAAIVAITEDPSKIIPGRSKVTFNALGLSAKYYSSLSAVSLNVNGTNYPMTISGSTASVSNIVVNSTSQISAIITVTDSRGLTKSLNLALDVVEYQPPTMTAQALRIAGYYSETEITPTANYTYIGTNAVTIRLQARKVSETVYTVDQALGSSGTSVVVLDNKSPWFLHFTITDSLGGSSVFEMTIGKGVPLFYFDIKRQSVAVGKFPEHDDAFEVDGDVFVEGDVHAAGVLISGARIADFIVEEGTDGTWVYEKWNSGKAKCWGRKTWTNVQISTKWGYDYYTDLTAISSVPDYPFKFKGLPSAHVTLSSTSGRCWPVQSTDESETNIGSIYAVAAIKYSGIRSVVANMEVVGKWK